MTVEPALSKPWLLWQHDPCQEGGWSVRGFDTYEAALKAAEFIHTEAEKGFQHQVEFMKESRPDDPWKRSDECYDGCVVTPGVSFRLDVDVSNDPGAEAAK